MKLIYKKVAITSIVIFLIAFVLDVIKVFEYDFAEIRSLTVFIYLISSLEHYKQTVKEKNETITELQDKLKKYQKKNNNYNTSF
ncbi:hypothetical protein [Flavobacteriaceae bacterium 14752]|uniref:hypothetical protein n=1 Tax=Mesohalobacter salilacus TaxID=2491711 RepID=UPI000F63742B|nr:hypothetical protein EIG84_09835 [Flavobacteriaceae bacterium 14752]